MKEFIVVLIITFLFSYCKSNKEDDILAFITEVDTLKFTYQNDRCGEWGGDEEIILIYRENHEEQIFADYLKQLKDCENDYEKVVKSISKKRIKISEEDKKLIVESINQLVENKLSREQVLAHAGLRSQVVLTDSTIFVHDFPSSKWVKFEMLTKKLIE